MQTFSSLLNLLLPSIGILPYSNLWFTHILMKRWFIITWNCLYFPTHLQNYLYLQLCSFFIFWYNWGIDPLVSKASLLNVCSETHLPSSSQAFYPYALPFFSSAGPGLRAGLSVQILSKISPCLNKEKISTSIPAFAPDLLADMAEW